MKDLLKKQPKVLRTHIVSLAKEIAKSNGRLLAVGGVVRDSLLSKETYDADLEVYNISPEKLGLLLEIKYTLQKVNLTGKFFGVYKIKLPKGCSLDIAVARTEQKTGSGHKNFSVQHTSLTYEESFKRRDFTINAIGYDPLTQELVDPFSGQTDLKKKILRAVNAKTFVEDPLRVYRAFQFAARFSLSPDPTTLGLLKKMIRNGELATLPSERITEEWRKLLLSPHPSRGLTLMSEVKLGAWQKTYELADQAAKIPHHDPTLVLAAVIYELKSPDEFLRTLNFGQVSSAALHLVSARKKLTAHLQSKEKYNAWRIYFRDSLPADCKTALLFAKITGLRTTKVNLPKDPASPLVTGGELLRHFPSLTPGPSLGMLIKKIERLRDEGIVYTKKDALKKIREFLHDETELSV
ncbi:MAG TPA: hypothetical protein VEA59_06290 [Patescibacteria group bacterium]|nr:hypothetical protein [Patescibacteria group bacterium]